MRKSKIGDASWNLDGMIAVGLDIGSWPTMLEVRKHLGTWLPDWPTWKSTEHWAEKSYFRNNFAFDGEYTLNLPKEAEKAVCELLRLEAIKPPSAEVGMHRYAESTPPTK